ncbi:hypothetical protein LX36DRAFT_451840 [Colletotrichum falcatum]|nr:hypothetical protein LX36DRAFT_451840 [Colletotrichum falcatum]
MRAAPARRSDHARGRPPPVGSSLLCGDVAEPPAPRQESSAQIYTHAHAHAHAHARSRDDGPDETGGRLVSVRDGLTPQRRHVDRPPPRTDRRLSKATRPDEDEGGGAIEPPGSSCFAKGKRTPLPRLPLASPTQPKPFFFLSP